MRFSLHKKFLFILFGDLNWIFFKDLNAKKVTMENRISVLPDINMEVGGGNLASFGTIASAIQIGTLEEFSKESSLLGVKADLGEFGTNRSPKAARIVRRKSEPIETRGRARKGSCSRDMLTALENRVVILEESIENMKETLELVEGHTDGLDSMKEQLRDFVLDSQDANGEKMKELLESTTEKLAEKDQNPEDMVAMVRETMKKMKRDIAMMATVSIAQVAMGNHEMQIGDSTTQGPRGRR
ncbi:hypothetical protein Gotur_031559 [Gossypium turneri]